jgi:hypothetical protein
MLGPRLRGGSKGACQTFLMAISALTSAAAVFIRGGAAAARRNRGITGTAGGNPRADDQAGLEGILRRCCAQPSGCVPNERTHP